MKRFDNLKTIQLICFVALSLLTAGIIIMNKGLYYTVLHYGFKPRG
ncbi:MAG: hypothetical protein HUJ78_05025 [Mogibacterium sp.]|nr:hypothetical protein [Mogibacterium sp.]